MQQAAAAREPRFSQLAGGPIYPDNIAWANIIVGGFSQGARRDAGHLQRPHVDGARRLNSD